MVRPTRRFDIPTLVTLLTVVASVLWGAATIVAKVGELDRRLVTMEETHERDRVDSFDAMDELFQRWFDRFGAR